jgi:hypothetical protein
MAKGSCLCGAVRFEVDGALGPVEVCHCTQCRQWTGHFLASVEVPRTSVTVHGAEHVAWYASSDKARRGFCARCGSTLFFDPLDRVKHAWTGIAMGSFEAPTHTRVNLHIFTAEKGDYYEILDGAPQNAR